LDKFIERERSFASFSFFLIWRYNQVKRKIFVGVEHLRQYLSDLHDNLYTQMLYPLWFYRYIIPAVWGLSVDVGGFGQSIPDLSGSEKS
jgi:hypothetical protein